MKKQFIALVIMLTAESATIFSANNNEINDELREGKHEGKHDRTIQQIEIKQSINQLSLNESMADKQKYLGQKTTETVHNIYRDDFEANVRSIVKSRSFFGYTAGITECLANTCMYIGMGLSTISPAIALIGSKQSSEIVHFSSTACFAAHVVLIGIAKYAAREESEREKPFYDLAKEAGFRAVVPLRQIIVDDGNGELNQQNVNKQESLTLKKSRSANK